MFSLGSRGLTHGLMSTYIHILLILCCCLSRRTRAETYPCTSNTPPHTPERIVRNKHVSYNFKIVRFRVVTIGDTLGWLL